MVDTRYIWLEGKEAELQRYKVISRGRCTAASLQRYGSSVGGGALYMLCMLYILHYVHEGRAAWHRRCRGAVVKIQTRHAVYVRCTGRIDESASGRKRRDWARGGIGGKYIGWDVYIPPTMSITPRVTRRLYERMQLAPDVKRRTPVSKFDGATRAPSVTSEISRSFFPSPFPARYFARYILPSPKRSFPDVNKI